MQVSGGLLPLGEIVTTHGLDGWLKLVPFNPKSAMLAAGRAVVLQKAGQQHAHEIEASKPFKQQFLLKLQGINHIEAAAQWIGATLCVDEAQLDNLAAGEFYVYQTIGLEVFDLTGQRIGVVIRTYSTPGGELYVVQGAAKEHLIPAVKEIIEKVDFTAGRMIINPPKGLLDL